MSHSCVVIITVHFAVISFSYLEVVIDINYGSIRSSCCAMAPPSSNVLTGSLIPINSSLIMIFSLVKEK